jgi:ribosome-associated protein
MPIDEKYIQFKAARSSGPGGQRVNKRATKVQGQVKIETLPFSEEEKKRIREKLSNRIDEDDELLVESEEERFQERNRERVIEKLNELIEEALHEDPPRIPTKKRNSVKEREIKHNRLRYQKKKSRREGKSSDIEEE